MRIIVIIFPRGSKSLRPYPQKINRWFWIALCGFIFFTPGCFTRLSVDRSDPPILDLNNYQPLAILPVPDAPGYPHSGLSLQVAAEEVLQEKRFALVGQEKVVQVLTDLNQTARGVSSDPPLLARFSAALGSKMLVVGTFLSYRVQKSYIAPNISEVWPGAGSISGYQSLPTYYQGTCEIRVRLQMLESEKGAVVWMAEGKGSGPSGSEAKILHWLIEDLMKGLPPLPQQTE
jgi:hypothetical protein